MAEYDSEAFDDFIGEEVVDHRGSPIGLFSCHWENHDGKPIWLGIQVSGMSNVTHLIPAKGVRLDDRKSYVVSPFSKAKVLQAPALGSGCELDKSTERKALLYYGADEDNYTKAKSSGGSKEEVAS